MTQHKICPSCKERPSHNQKRGGYCPPCNREYGKRNYHENKQRYFAQAAKRNKELDALINQSKNRPCADCGKQYPPYVMDFDHLDEDDKSFNIATMRRRKMAFEKIRLEIAKCEVVCSNCHRERTNQRNPARYLKP